MTCNPSADRIRHLFSYDPETGVFARRQSVRGSGSTVGCVNHDGYRLISVDRRRYYAHRLAWLYVFECMPESQIDHINGERDDNRISNLRAVTNEGNCHNRARLSTLGTSGYSGVSYHKGAKKWSAHGYQRYRKVHLGLFETKADAADAVHSWRTENYTEYTGRGS